MGLLVAAGAVVASATVVGVQWYRKVHPVHHFAVVREGVLYRSGQPDSGQFHKLLEQYRLRTVVNLRGQMPDENWWRQEQEVCRRHGLKLVSIDMRIRDEAEKHVRQFLDVVADPRNQPVLVHCEAGSARTGFAVAAYRIVTDGWTYEEAMKEAEKFQFRLDNDTNREYVKVLRRLAEGKGKGSLPASTQPASRPLTCGPGLPRSGRHGGVDLPHEVFQDPVGVLDGDLAGADAPVPAAAVLQHQRADVHPRRPVDDAVPARHHDVLLSKAPDDLHGNVLSRVEAVEDEPVAGVDLLLPSQVQDDHVSADHGVVADHPAEE
jgi:protein-tyrosine phosphatase